MLRSLRNLISFDIIIQVHISAYLEDHTIIYSGGLSKCKSIIYLLFRCRVCHTMAIIVLSNGHKNVGPFHPKRKHTRRNKLHINYYQWVKKKSVPTAHPCMLHIIYASALDIPPSHSTWSGEAWCGVTRYINTPTIQSR